MSTYLTWTEAELYLWVLPVLKLIWLDAVLSGDNAVVVAMACRGLPDRQRTIGLAMGVALAIALRIGLSFGASFALEWAPLTLVGAAFLVYVAVSVIVGEDDEAKAGHKPNTLLKAAVVIAFADLMMSIDNIVAIAAASHGDPYLYVTGLLISMTFMIVGASLITKFIDRFPIVIWLSGAFLGWLAGGMVGSSPYWANVDLPEAMVYYPCAVAGVLIVVAVAATIKLATGAHRQPT